VTRLCLRRGVVLAAGDSARPMQELDVRLGGTRRRALADTALIGPAQPGDEVIVNIADDVVIVAPRPPRRGVAHPDLDGYLASGLPARSLEEDPAFFASALSAGDVLAHVTRAAMV
jgi:hypothetical protein